MSNSTEKNKRKAWKKEIRTMAGQDASTMADQMKIVTANLNKTKKQLLFYQIGFFILLPMCAGCGLVIYYMRGLL